MNDACPIFTIPFFNFAIIEADARNCIILDNGVVYTNIKGQWDENI
jgi:hypothetical protein